MKMSDLYTYYDDITGYCKSIINILCCSIYDPLINDSSKNITTFGYYYSLYVTMKTVFKLRLNPLSDAEIQHRIIGFSRSCIITHDLVYRVS